MVLGMLRCLLSLHCIHSFSGQHWVCSWDCQDCQSSWAKWGLAKVPDNLQQVCKCHSYQTENVYCIYCSHRSQRGESVYSWRHEVPPSVNSQIYEISKIRWRCGTPCYFWHPPRCLSQKLYGLGLPILTRYVQNVHLQQVKRDAPKLATCTWVLKWYMMMKCWQCNCTK